MPSRGLEYVRDNGIVLEEDYPYRSVEGTCEKPKGGSLTFQNFSGLNLKTANSLLKALTKGPVSVILDASNFKYYDPSTSEIFSECGKEVNHAMLAVGYDEESFLFKNSWGTDWGMDGYIKLPRSGACNVFS
jgi:C1A family cysteine protease